MRREPVRRRVTSSQSGRAGLGARFPWELALGAFAGASILLAVVLGAAGSGAPSLILAGLGVGLASMAGVVAWRANGITSPARVQTAPTIDVPLAFDRADRRAPTTRSGDDGADFDLSSIPEFRSRRDAPAVPVAPKAPVGKPEAPARPVPIPEGAEASVREFADAAGAVAGAVLMRRGRRLVAVAVSGNWGAARNARVSSGGTGSTEVPDAHVGPPEFPIDDVLADVLASVPRAMPLERWEELTDVPSGMLPLLALGDQGVAVAVAISHRRRLLALWVASGRDGSRRYTDRELVAFEAVARERATLLVPAFLDG
jgi:hypothetical protein